MQTQPGPPAGERLARLEVQIEQLVSATNRAHADWREHLQWQRRCFEAQELRLAALERSTEETRVHLRWIKAIWLAVQGAVVGWLGLGK